MQVAHEKPDDRITLRWARELGGLPVATLQVQARTGRFRADQLAYTWFTTRRWLHGHLTPAGERDRGAKKCLPEGDAALE